ncbi:TAP-like protein-domain-containing protein [Lophiotrema nucula]|uniref:TAP-like protein-domain-containing protein n=1 Tax=Lophiotrema nucula TaxID=690887 RepID=A0A6A5YUQ4_9PLEO|nr:TAP-like protein-domain-containing protein [Lophiotrema nucula]
MHPERTMASRLLCIAIGAVPVFSIPISTQTPRSGISWTECDTALELPSNLQCANLSVPVNWDVPWSGETITLGMVRLPRPSNSTAERIGHLFINPGGPGGSAIQTVAGIAAGRRNASSDLLNRFDIIGVDPRGVGQSAESQCDPAIWNERVSQFPKTKEDYDRLVDKNKRLGESCLNRTGDVVNYLDTISAVKDHEAVRVALGERLNWLGLSYGTQLGSQYAQLFPDNIRVMVLDGMLQHSQTESSNILIESAAYAAELVSFFTWAGTNDSSPLQGQDVEKLWYGILQKATDTPIPAPGCDDVSCRKDVNEEEIRLNAQGFVLSPRTSARATFANALLQASEGNATLLSTPLASDSDPSLYAGITIGCQDWSSYASSFEDFQAKMRIGEVFAPLNKGACQSWTLQASCVGWPAPLTNPPAKLKVQTQDPILMVNAIRDPSTSYTWAVGMLEEVENNVLLTRNGDGHTSWGLGGATTDAINHFLISTELPAPGTVLDS